MTLKELIRYCQTIGMVARKVDGEYQVKPKGRGSWESGHLVYYTKDIEDAADTARAMARVGDDYG